MDKYTIIYGGHDMNAEGGTMKRTGSERAFRAARLLRECGYTTILVIKKSN